MFERIITDWGLVADGTPFETAQSWLLHVRLNGDAATLKWRKPKSEETLTATLLGYYGGDGAIRLLRAGGDVVLMERACGARSLMHMATSGQDDAAAEILADVVATLHAPRTADVPIGLVPLAERFGHLTSGARREPRLKRAAEIAAHLLATAERPVVLHGDLHHDNVLFDDTRGWRVIDPNGLYGERTYEIANLLCNPYPHGRIVHDPDRMQRCANIYARRLGLASERILAFALAHAGVASAWALHDGNDASHWLGCVEVLEPMVR
jgi:streptomycin 6-kinase